MAVVSLCAQAHARKRLADADEGFQLAHRHGDGAVLTLRRGLSLTRLQTVECAVTAL
jgi:hypothetical protein